MSNGIHPSLIGMAVDINTLLPLEKNPRVGDVDAITASYAEFGQVKPIVAKRNDDGTATVIAGNHQLEAAKILGWDQIAVIYLEGDDSRAVAFALADNRTVELGYSEPEILYELISSVSEDYPELLEGLGWDEFEIAEYEQEAYRNSSEMSTSGSYVPPVLIDRNTEIQGFDDVPELRPQEFTVTRDSEGEKRIVAPSSSDQNDIAVRGSTMAAGAAQQAVVQFTLVFDNPAQQSRWYDFIRWLRSDVSIVGNTTAERLMDFIGQHSEI
jgi:hypothetical protein